MSESLGSKKGLATGGVVSDAPLLGAVRSVLDDSGLVESTVHAARARVLAPKERRSPHAALGLLAFGIACAALLLSYTRARRSDDTASRAALTFRVADRSGSAGDTIVTNDVTRRSIDFDDGTRIDVGASSTARVVSLDADGGRIRLEHGTLHAAFHHRDDRTHWTIEAGPVGVEVTGTRFDVTWDAKTETFALSMHEGSVALHGCGLPARASGTEVVRGTCGKEVSHPRPAEHPSPSPPPSASSPSARALDVRPATSSTAARQDDQATLVARANDARRTGDATRARTTLVEIRRRFPGQSAAAQAAFDLGTIAFDLDRQPAEAATWFRTYRSEAPTGPLAREALGRLMEAIAAAGDEHGAAIAARDYLRDYPGGSHARLAQRLSAVSPER